MLNIDQLKDILEEATQKNAASIAEYRLAKRYYGGKQLPSDVITILEERGQPPIHENILAMLIEKIQGYKDMSRQDTEVIGRQKADRDMALVLGDIIKAISDTLEFSRQKKRNDENLLLGLGVAEVWIKELDASDEWGKKEKAITVSTIPSDMFYIDPYSCEEDASDAKYFIKLMSMDFEDAKVYFGQKANALKLNIISRYRKRVNIYEFWIKEPDSQSQNGYTWNRYIMGDTLVLLRYEKSPFANGMHPFAVCKLKIDDENRWYGFFRNLKPQIDFINFAENRMANMIGSSKILYESDAVDDADTFAKEINIDNAVVRVKNGALADKKIEIVNNQPQISNLSAKVADARATAQRLSGLNDETLGLAVNRLSGSAIEQRNNAGIVSLQGFLSASAAMDKMIFLKAIDLITRYFDAEQVFRIVEKDNAERYFTINEKERDANGDVKIKDGKAVVKNKIKVGMYDISLNLVPHVKTKREDILKHWAEIIKTITPIDPNMIKRLIPLMLDDSDSPIARDVREMMISNDQQASKQASPAEQLQMQNMQLDLQLKQAKIQNLKADALKKIGEGKEEMGRARG
ncbi:MAG: hypothetical protein ACFNUJ_02000 [Campylobacter curvus]